MMEGLPIQRSRRHRGRRVLGLLGAAVMGAALIGPATASAGSNIGGGPIAGTVSFDPGFYIPPPGAPCAQTSFSLNGTSTEAFVLNTVGGVSAPISQATFAGPFAVTPTS